MVEQRRKLSTADTSSCPIQDDHNKNKKSHHQRFCFRPRVFLLFVVASFMAWRIFTPTVTPSIIIDPNKNSYLDDQNIRDPPVDCASISSISSTPGLVVQAFAKGLPGTQQALAIVPELRPFAMHVHNTTDDAYISHDIASLGCFECELVAYAMQALQQQQDTSSLLLDIGGNIGMYSLTAASLHHDTLVVEPFSKNWHHTCASVLQNDHPLASHVTLFNRAILADRGTVAFQLDELSHNQGSVRTIIQNQDHPNLNHNNLHHDNVVEGVDYAQGVPLGELLQPYLPTINQRPVVLKVDVEGHECHVLGGALEFLRTIHLVYVALEWSHKRLYRCYRRAEIFDLLHHHFQLQPYMYNPGHARNGRPVWKPLQVEDWETTWVQQGKRKETGLFDVVWSKTPLV